MTLRTQLTDLVDGVPLPGETLGAMAQRIPAGRTADGSDSGRTR